MATVLICFSSQNILAQTIPSPVIDSVLTVDHDFFYNGEIIVPYSTGHVSVTNNANVQIHSTTDVDLLPGFTASVDSGCGEFVAGIRECPEINIDFTTTQVKCFGNCDGKIELNISGGKSPYFYKWDDYAYNSSIRSDLCSGDYFIKITDSNGCNLNDTIIVNQPDSIILNINTLNTSCKDSSGKAVAIVTGGILPYNYFWSCSPRNDSIIDSLLAGYYFVSIIDAKGCELGSSFNIIDTNSATAQINILKNITCNKWNDGGAEVNVTNGSPPFQYFWIESKDSSRICSTLKGGINHVLIKDSIGCIQIQEFEMVEPNEITVNINTENSTCGNSDGKAFAAVCGGTLPYQYLWKIGSTDSFAVNLHFGKDTLLIIDQNGCKKSKPYEIVETNQIFLSTKEINHVNCWGLNQGSANLVASGGIYPYSYFWLKDSIDSPTRTDLYAGKYPIRVTDSGGCILIDEINIQDPPKIEAILYFSPPSSDTSFDGNISSLINGGIPPYSYTWTPVGQTTPNIQDIGIGYDTLTIMDANGCSVTSAIQISSRPVGCFTSPLVIPCSPITVNPCNSNLCYKDIVLDFGADPSGNTNTTCAFLAASEFFNARHGNGTLYIPPGIYRVGSQNFNGTNPNGWHSYGKTGNDILCFDDCINLSIEGKIDGGLVSKILFDDCLEYGLFDWISNERWILPTTPITLYTNIASPGTFLKATNCGNLSISNIDIDGNSTNLSYGGHYNDGIQVAACGIELNSCVHTSIISVEAHHFGRDGITIDDNLRGVNPLSNTNLMIRDSKFNWNGRCGCAWGGGRNAIISNTEFNYNSMGRFGSHESVGIDFEYTGGNPMEHFLFLNCKFEHNLYSGIECSFQNRNYVTDVTFRNCTFISSETNRSNYNSNSIIPGGKDFDFQRCNFYGAMHGGYNDIDCQTCINDDNLKFRDIPPSQSYGCYFSEEYNHQNSYNSDVVDECSTTHYQIHLWLVDFSIGASRALFENCVWETNKQMQFLNISGGSDLWNNVRMRNNTFINHGITNSGILGSANFIFDVNSSLHVISGGPFFYAIYNLSLPTYLDQVNLACTSKYRNPYIANKVTDAFSCSGCATHLPLFCPAACYPPAPCSRMSQTLSQNIILNDITIQPNPVYDYFTVSNLTPGEFVTIYSSDGTILYSELSANNSIEINSANLPNGVLIVKTDQSRTAKLIILK